MWGPLQRFLLFGLDTTLCDKVCQWPVTDRWFSPGTRVSSTNKTDLSRYNWNIVESDFKHHNPFVWFDCVWLSWAILVFECLIFYSDNISIPINEQIFCNVVQKMYIRSSKIPYFIMSQVKIVFDSASLELLANQVSNRIIFFYFAIMQKKCMFLAHLAKGNVSFYHHLVSVICRPLTFRILIFSSKTPQPNELKLGRKHL